MFAIRRSRHTFVPLVLLAMLALWTALPLGHAAAASTCDITTGFPNLHGRDLSGCDLSFAFLPQASGSVGQTVMMIDFQFTPKTLVVPVGTTVTWTNAGATIHTATSDTGVFNTGDVAPGQSQSFTFSNAGTFPYYCMHHGAPGGIGMAGTIIVIPPVVWLPLIATP